jgi:hypothetical protein
MPARFVLGPLRQGVRGAPAFGCGSKAVGHGREVKRSDGKVGGGGEAGVGPQNFVLSLWERREPR